MYAQIAYRGAGMGPDTPGVTYDNGGVPLPINGAWTKYTRALIAPPGATQIEVGLLSTGQAAAGAWCVIDNVSLTEISAVDSATLTRDYATNILKIKDLGVLEGKLADAAVIFAKIKNGAVSGVKIPTNGIDSNLQLANYTISRDTLFLNAIIRDATIIDCYANKVTAGSFVGRDLTLAIGAYTARIIGDADPTFGSVARAEVRVAAAVYQRTFISAGGLACFQANNTKGFDVFVDTSASYVGGVGEFYRAGSAHGVTLDGRTGKVTATTYANGFKSDMLSHKIDGWQFPVDFEVGTPAAGIVTLYQLAQRFNGLIVALLKQGIIG